jgi:hypothetical protein
VCGGVVVAVWEGDVTAELVRCYCCPGTYWRGPWQPQWCHGDLVRYCCSYVIQGTATTYSKCPGHCNNLLQLP